MKNQELRKTAKNLAVDASNVASITKGTIGGCSIEIETIDPKSFDSYLYLIETVRDEDFEEVRNLLKA
jgi:Ni,Fe-hydrogenase III small subunit